MRDLVNGIEVVDVEAHYDLAAAGRCGSRDHRAEMKRATSPIYTFSLPHMTKLTVLTLRLRKIVIRLEPELHVTRWSCKMFK